MSGYRFDAQDITHFGRPIEGVSDVPLAEIKELQIELNRRHNFERNFNLVSGNVIRAINEFEFFADHFPDSGELNHYLGLAYYKAGQFKKAHSSFKTATANPDDRLNSRAWADALGDQMKLGRLETYLNREIEADLNYQYGHDCIEFNPQLMPQTRFEVSSAQN